jgi:N-acetylglutamate synthase-like GNAT family acetyltransferase
MSNYSEFIHDNKKTRSQVQLEEQINDFKIYKNASQNFSNLDGMDKNGSTFGIYNNLNDNNSLPNTLFHDPRYTQSNSRDKSRKQLNNVQNINVVKNIPGYNIFDSNEKFQEYQETNYEDKKFLELNRDMELGLNLPLRTFGDILVNSTDKTDKTDKIDTNDKETKNKINYDKILNKIKKNKNDDNMPKKNIVAENIKGKILQFKNCTEELQNLISTALINEWPEDFKLKKIHSNIGVKNFILHNFKDKMNIFFVLFDDQGGFVSTFAVDTENFAPYISHLYVNPNLRNRGFGKKTLKYAEKYIKKLGFDNSNLWCEENLVNYYKKNNYIIDSPMKVAEDKTVWKMSKNL